MVALTMYLRKPSAGARPAACRWALDHVLDIDPAVQIFVGLGVLVGIGGARYGIVVRLGKEARHAQHDAGETLVAVKQLAQVLGGGLGDAIDVLGHRHHVFGDPGGGLARGRDQRVAEYAGGAGVDEGADAGRDGLLQQVERAGDVGVDEVLPAVGGDVRLVQGGGVEHPLDAGRGAADRVAIRYRAGCRGKRAGGDVEAGNLVAGSRRVRTNASPRWPLLPVTRIRMGSLLAEEPNGPRP